jgi:hypothetical protein
MDSSLFCIVVVCSSLCSVRAVLTSLLHVLTGSLSHAASHAAAFLTSDLLQFGVSAAHAELITGAYLSALPSLVIRAGQRTLRVNELHDISWKFGVTASTSEGEKVGACFLQLQLTIQRAEKREQVLMELSLPQFYEFLKQMQLAQRQMNGLAK